MTYAVKEIFWTLQGEGANAGRAAAFLRLAGCNLWSGRDDDRERDALRHAVPCPRWCDTDFVGGARLHADDVVTRLREAAGHERPGLVVVTGGEPLLQLDDELLDALRPLGDIAVETNGTARPRWRGRGPDHITVSPKAYDLQLARCDELRVPFPDMDPTRFTIETTHRYVSPVAVGRGLAAQDAMCRAAEFCMLHPAWRLSLQTHKILGIP